MRSFILVHLFLFISSTAFANGGGLDTGGTDDSSPSSGAAWFLGNRPVQVCITRNQNFPVSNNVFLQEFQKAVSEWKKYFQEHLEDNLTYFLFGNNDDATFSKMCTELSFDFRFVQDCKPTHSDGLSTQRLNIFLGVENEEITKIKKENYDNPLAFTFLLNRHVSRDSVNNGNLWVSNTPLLANIHKLHGLLLHELGHVFGVPHNDYTIMSEQIITSLKSRHIQDEEYTIDRQNVLLNSWKYESDVVGLIDSITLEAKNTFQYFLQTKPFGEPRSYLQLINISNDEHGNNMMWDYDLILSDEQRSFKMKFSHKQNLEDIHVETSRSFSSYIEMNGGSSIHCMAFRRTNETYPGKLTLPDGKTYYAVLEKYKYQPLIPTNSIEQFNRDPRFKDVRISLSFFDEQWKKRRLIGPSAYWNFVD